MVYPLNNPVLPYKFGYKGVYYSRTRFSDDRNSFLCRIIRALDDISHLFQLIRSSKKRFIKKYFLSEVLQQLPTDDLAVGISLANNESDKIDNESIIKSIKEGDDVMAGEIDVGIYLPAELLKGKFDIWFV